MKIIGVTGNMGSGKSTVSKILEDNFNAYIIDADKINHDILKFNKGAYNEIVQSFGKNVLDENMEIDRKKLGRVVFEDERLLNKLTAISHKYIIEKIRNIISEIKENGNYKYIVVDAPLLIESGLYNDVSEVWLIGAPAQIRTNRIMCRDNMLSDDVRKRTSKQTDFDSLKPYADMIIENDGDFETLKKKIYDIIRVDV